MIFQSVFKRNFYLVLNSNYLKMKKFFSLLLIVILLSVIPFMAFSQPQSIPREVSALTDSLKNIYEHDNRVDLFLVIYNLDVIKLLL